MTCQWSLGLPWTVWTTWYKSDTTYLGVFLAPTVGHTRSCGLSPPLTMNDWHTRCSGAQDSTAPLGNAQAHLNKVGDRYGLDKGDREIKEQRCDVVSASAGAGSQYSTWLTHDGHGYGRQRLWDWRFRVVQDAGSRGNLGNWSISFKFYILSCTYLTIYPPQACMSTCLGDKEHTKGRQLVGK